MNVRINCGSHAKDAVRAAVVAGIILTVASPLAAFAADDGPSFAPGGREYIVTDLPDDAFQVPAESGDAALAAAGGAAYSAQGTAPDPVDDPALLEDDTDGELFADEGVAGEAPANNGLVELSGHHGPLASAGGSCDSCVSCSGRGCSECRSSEGWFNSILCDVKPRLIGQVDAIYLWQGAIPSRPLYVSASAPFDTVLDADQAQTPVSVGTRYNLQLNLDCTYAFEGSYFSVYGFEGEQSTPHSDGGYAMDNLAGLDFSDINWANVRTNAGIQSAEFNWRRKTGTPITWLAGFRWVEWNQGMQIVDIYSTPGGSAFDRINTQTGNDLYGAQVGADLMLWNRWKDLSINGIGKGGIFYNRAYSRTNVPTELFPIDGDAKADQTAFFGEVGANATVKLTHWLSGIATAADQLERVGQAPPLERPRINTNGSVLLHGATTGLEARW